MGGYLIRRFLLIIPTLFFVTVLVFSLARFIPGSVIDRMVSEMAGYGIAQGGEKIDEAAIRHELGLDVPVYTQYIRWAIFTPLTGILSGQSHHRMPRHYMPVGRSAKLMVSGGDIC